MRKVSILAAVFFALAWLAVAADDERNLLGTGLPDAPPTTRPAPSIPPQYTPRPSTTPDAAPTWLTPQQFKPMPGMQSHTVSTPTPDGSHLVTVTTTPISNAAPTATNNWQIHRTDSDTLLLNTATGETWFLDKSGDRPRKWTPIARDASPPVYTPAVPVPAPTPQEGERPAVHFQPAEAPAEQRPAVPPSQEFQTR
jgi:hypothetical protein